MPTYQYACTECGHAFDQVQSFTDDSLTECPECQGRLRKLFNAVGVVFKGSGFYRNDSRKPEGASTSGSSEAATATEPKPGGKAEATAKTDTKTESKPPAKTEKKSDRTGTNKPAASTTP